MNQFELQADLRQQTGTGAMRRLRRTGMIPAVIYGAGKDAVSLALKSNALKKQIENEAFFSHILTVKVGSDTEQAVLKAMQRDPVTSEVTHLDLQRIVATEAIEMRVPLHFVNEAICPGKKAGGVVSHLMVEVEISCLPKDLPEYIEVDMASLELGQMVHLSQLQIPAGVELLSLVRDPDLDPSVVSVQVPTQVEEEEETEEGTAGAEAAAPAPDADETESD
jgi:large subunit ribosomal protein L25